MLVIVCWSLAVIAAVIVGFALAADIKAERAAKAEFERLYGNR